MPSTYSPNLALELMATGEDLNIWGSKTNNNLYPLIEQGMVSAASVAIADIDTTITMLNGTTCAARCFYLTLTGVLTAQRNLIVPTINKTYVILNSTTGGYGVQVKTTAGTGIVVQPGLARFLYVDSTNVIEMLNSIQNLEVVNALQVDGNLTVAGTASFSTPITGAQGGTGVANTGKTITLGGNLTTSGAFATTLTATAGTTLTLPITGTLATLAGAETLTNKTLTAPVIATIVNSGTLTLPTSTDTLVGKATTDTLTNKTFNTAGTGNSFLINGTAITTVTGTGANVLAASPALTGTPTAPTAAASTNTTQVATTAYVDRVGVQQIQTTQTGAYASGTTAIPVDDTIPQNTEGDQYMTVSITPKSATSKLLVNVIFYSAEPSGAAVVTVALFQDSTADALAAGQANYATTNTVVPVAFSYVMTSGTTSATTFKVRAGPDAGTINFNGRASARLLGGVMASSITVTEIGA